ncbi:HAD family hydrolase [Pengzhenrongella sp.]|jgi:phosphoserine phosphatase|uniref:HAD family hydrolase n=1 Tax=Pengzhenrongella sp. TaxID=2888820 RepID=UPI002F93985C
MVRGAVFFDVDGTLVPGTSSSQHLAARLGHLGSLRDAEDSYAAGTLSNHAVSVLDARGWEGRAPSEVGGWLDELPLVDGIAEVVTWCRAQHLAPVLATLAWEPVGAYLCARFGFDGSCGPRLEIVDGRYSGQVAAHLDEFAKRDYALAEAARLGLDPASCAAIGDSRSDVPLFERVGLAVAFNANAAARAVAHSAVDGDDLRAVLPHLSTWLAGTR